MSTRILFACFIFLVFSSTSQGVTYSWRSADSRNAKPVMQYSDTCPTGVHCNVVKAVPSGGTTSTSTTSSGSTSTTSSGSTSTTSSGSTSTTSSGSTSTTSLWSAGMEMGNLSEWYYPCTTEASCPAGAGGGKFNTLQGDAVASKDHAHSGSWSAKLTMLPTTTSSSATRLFRWHEPGLNRELYYSVWYFIPQNYTAQLSGFLNLLQWKSVILPGTVNDPIFILGAVTYGAPHMRFVLTWWPGLTIEGPQEGQNGGRTWTAPVDIPIGRWFNIEARYVCADDFTGAIQVWQDGVQIFHLEGAKTGYVNGKCQASVNNYGTKINPSPVVIYVDDVAISKTRIGL